MLLRLLGEDIQVSTTLNPALGRVKVDPGQIEQVLMNLLVNARDAMRTGGKITITTDNVMIDESVVKKHLSMQSGPHIKLTVSDTGTGMDAETQKRIFEPFFTTKEVGKGTGLGLSTVYGIVKQSDGYISVYSEVGHGTTFKVYLPRVDEAVESEAAIEQAVSGGTETILIVEDEEMVRTLANTILKGFGYNVLEAANGAAGFQLCQEYQEQIHLLLTDVVMPQMSGRELATQVASLRPDMKVLYMSGYTDDVIVHHGVLEEGTPFLEKPFAPDALARKVRGALDA
jgi:CheY-like chemotaxis protein